METVTHRAGFVGGGFLAGVQSRALRAGFGCRVAVVSLSSSSAAPAGERLGPGGDRGRISVRQSTSPNTDYSAPNTTRS